MRTSLEEINYIFFIKGVYIFDKSTLKSNS